MQYSGSYTFTVSGSIVVLLSSTHFDVASCELSVSDPIRPGQRSRHADRSATPTRSRIRILTQARHICVVATALTRFLQFIGEVSGTLACHTVVVGREGVVTRLIAVTLFYTTLVTYVVAGVSVIPTLLTNIIVFLVRNGVANRGFTAVLSGKFTAVHTTDVITIAFILVNLLAAL